MLSWLLYCKLMVTQSIVSQDCGSNRSGSPHSNQEAVRHEGFRDNTPFKNVFSVTYFLQSVPSFPISQYCHQIKLHWFIKSLANELLEVFQSHWWGIYGHRGPQWAIWNIYCWYLRPPLLHTHQKKRELGGTGPFPSPSSWSTTTRPPWAQHSSKRLVTVWGNYLCACLLPIVFLSSCPNS